METEDHGDVYRDFIMIMAVVMVMMMNMGMMMTMMVVIVMMMRMKIKKKKILVYGDDGEWYNVNEDYDHRYCDVDDG